MTKLRVALLIDSSSVPAWAYSMLKEIYLGEYAEVVLCVENGTEKVRESKWQKFRKHWNALAFLAYDKIDRMIFRSEANADAFIPKDISELFPDVPVLKVKPRQSKFSDWFRDEDLEEIKIHDPDLMIRLGFRILRGEILRLPRYGIWSYHHADNRINRGGPPGVWEVLNQEAYTGATLQILGEDLDGGRVLSRSASLTDSISINRNRNNYYWTASGLLPRKLKELRNIGGEAFYEKYPEEGSRFYTRPLYRRPENGVLLKKIMLLHWKKLRFRFQHLFFLEQWILLFRLEKSAGLSTSLYRFKEILPPKDRFWADPHVVYREDRYFIFIEELLYSRNKGHISVIEMDDQGNYSDPQKILEKPYHLSYPFVFEDKGTWYMIPETNENQTIELYRCVKFPSRWEHIKNLMENVRAFDTTIYFQDNKYWMYTNLKLTPGGSGNDELYLFYTDDLINGNWRSHPQNPVISDVHRARPAGRLLELDGKLIRPSQNSSVRYGHALNINHVEQINTTNYRERNLQQLKPEWDPKIKALHTLAYEHKLTVLDAIKLRRR